MSLIIAVHPWVSDLLAEKIHRRYVDGGNHLVIALQWASGYWDEGNVLMIPFKDDFGNLIYQYSRVVDLIRGETDVLLVGGYYSLCLRQMAAHLFREGVMYHLDMEHIAPDPEWYVRSPHTHLEGFQEPWDGSVEGLLGALSSLRY